MVSRSIHSSMMIYSAHKHAESERDTDTQTDMHTQLIHDVYIVICSNTQAGEKHTDQFKERKLFINNT